MAEAAVRARDVQVDKLFRARCRRPGCGWAGAEHATYAAANAERQAHLNAHTLRRIDSFRISTSDRLPRSSAWMTWMRSRLWACQRWKPSTRTRPRAVTIGGRRSMAARYRSIAAAEDGDA